MHSEVIIYRVNSRVSLKMVIAERKIKQYMLFEMIPYGDSKYDFFKINFIVLYYFQHIWNFFPIKLTGWGCRSVFEQLTSMRKASDSTSGVGKKEVNEYLQYKTECEQIITQLQYESEYNIQNESWAIKRQKYTGDIIIDLGNIMKNLTHRNNVV